MQLQGKDDRLQCANGTFCSRAMSRGKIREPHALINRLTAVISYRMKLPRILRVVVSMGRRSPLPSPSSGRLSYSTWPSRRDPPA